MIRHETGPRVVMNCASFTDSKHSYLVAGQEGHCQLYNVQSLVVTEEEYEKNLQKELNENGHLRRRRTSSGPYPQKNGIKLDKNKNDKKLTFVIKPWDSIQTDFSKSEEQIQRVVRISHDGKFMGTGGTDGIVRLWNFPNLKPHKTLKAHSKEIDDIDFSPYDNYLITIAKDGLAIVWDCSSGKEIRKLNWSPPEGVKYLFKRCR